MPAHNEAESIALVLEEWLVALRRCVDAPFSLLVIDDASSDGTGDIVQKIVQQNREIVLSRNADNLRHGGSVMAGYRLALDAGAQWILQIDSDGQCDPAFFEGFWHDRQRHSAIFGCRQTRADGQVRMVVSKIVRLVVLATTRSWIADANVPYRLMRRDLLERALGGIPADFRQANVALSVNLARLCTIDWRPIHFRDRTGGTPTFKMLQFASEGAVLFRQLLALPKMMGSS